jgi:tetratricopeptide (TPR) repeat protein
LPAQVKVKGIVTEANTNPSAKSLKKVLSGVQIKAMGAVASEVTDNSGFFTLVFQGKKPGDLIRGVSFQKSGYEVFNRDVLENWKVANDPNWIDKIKMCPAGTIDRLTEYNYKSLYNTLLAQYEKQKGELKKLKISDADLNEKYRSLEENFQSQQKQLEDYAERFARIDFDDVSDLYRRAYFLFSKGDLDSVAVILEEADLMGRTTKRIEERNRIQVVKAEAARQEEKNEAGIKEDMEALKILAQTYVMKFEYEKATPLYEQLVRLDSTNVDNLLASAIFFGQVKHYDQAIHLFSKVVYLTDSLDWHQGSAKRRMGGIQGRIGFYEPALKNLLESYRIYKSLYVKDSTNTTFFTGLRVMLDLGDIYVAMGREEDALAYFKQFNSLAQKNYNLNINDSELKELLMVSNGELGFIHLKMGHIDEALKYFKEDLKLSKELYEANPRDERLKYNLTISYSRLGDICMNQGHMDEALKYFEDYNRSVKELYELNPRDENMKEGLANSYGRLGSIHQGMGHVDKALKYYEEDLKLSKELYESDPRDENSKINFAASYESLGDIHQAMGHMEDALKYFEKDLTLTKEFYNSNPKNVFLKQNFAISQQRLGSIYQAMGHRDEAFKYLKEYNRLMKELYDSNPQDNEIKEGLATSYKWLGDINQAVGHLDEALKCFKEDIMLSKELYEANPKNESLQSKLAISYQRLGDINRTIGHLDEALTYLEDYNRFTKELYASNPENESMKNDLANSYEKLGEIHWALGHFIYKDNTLKELKKVDGINRSTGYFLQKSKNLSEKLAVYFYTTGKIYKDCFQQTGIEKYDEWKMDCLSELDSICKNYLSEADSFMNQTLSDKAIVYYLKADSLYLKKNEISEDLNNIWNRGWIYERLSLCGVNDKEKLIYLENALQFRLEANKSYSDGNKHTVIISDYGNLSWYYLLDKQFAKSEMAARTAIETARKNNIEGSQYNWVYTKLAHSLLFQGKFEEAKKIYLEWKDKVYPQDTTKTFRFFFLKDLDDLKQSGITHPDVENIKELLK